MVEALFVYPGLGQSMIDPVRNRDFPVVQAITLILTSVNVLLDLLADVLSTITNQRLIHGKWSHDMFFAFFVGRGVFFIVGHAARGRLLAAAPAHQKPTFRGMPRTASFGLAVILIYVPLAILAPVTAPFGEGRVLGAQCQPYWSPHYLGTGKLGRDMLIRLIYGAQRPSQRLC